MYSITIIADASFCSETKAAGYGAWIAGSLGRRAFEGPLNAPRDNNVAETMAIVNALWHGFKTGLIKAKSDILIQSDSETAIAILKGDKVASNQQYRDAVAYVHRLVSCFSLTLRYKHVPGHTKGADSRTRAQNHCDIAAKRQMLMQRAEILALPFEERPVTKPKGSTNYLRSRRRYNHG
jgi:ribonuclease HI